MSRPILAYPPRTRLLKYLLIEAALLNVYPRTTVPLKDHAEEKTATSGDNKTSRIRSQTPV
jgi:hypothetical protein